MSATYSFGDFIASYIGPEGTFDLSSEGIAAEGVTIAFAEDQGSVTMGANGDGMHNLHRARNGTVTFRTLKTARLNNIFSRIWQSSTADSSGYGNGLITCRNAKTGDLFVCKQCGVRKFPDNVNATDGGTNEWVFNSIRITPSLGDGNPQLSANGAIAS